jgi:hypothetical protein
MVPPEVLISDNGPPFTEAKLKEFLKLWGLYHHHTTPLWHQSNGLLERQKRSILKRLHNTVANKLDRKEELLKYLFAYCTTPHAVTSVAPAILMIGRQVHSNLLSIQAKPTPWDEEVRGTDRWKKDVGKRYTDEKKSRRNLATSYQVIWYL